MSAKLLDERPDAAINVLRMSSSQNTCRDKGTPLKKPPTVTASKSIESLKVVVVKSPVRMSTISKGAPTYGEVRMAKSLSKFGTIGTAPQRSNPQDWAYHNVKCWPKEKYF